MMFTVGTSKTGRAITLNRVAGETCGAGCPFQNPGIGPEPVPRVARCYGKCTQSRFPRARAIAVHNRVVSVRDWSYLLETAHRLKLPVRLHATGGDFGTGRGNDIDLDYLHNLETALDARRVDGRTPVWCYTHIYHWRLAALQFRGVTVYASVHGPRSITRASRAKFSRFALALPWRTARTRPQLRPVPVWPGLRRGTRAVRMFGNLWPVCPAQIDHDTDCNRCRLCIGGAPRVAFLLH
jgi:hypothetical protein